MRLGPSPPSFSFLLLFSLHFSLVSLAGLMTTFRNKSTWEEAYDLNGIGGLISGPLSAMGGFGSFLLVVLALSICANNVPNMYSFSLSEYMITRRLTSVVDRSRLAGFQVFGRYAQAIPRMQVIALPRASPSKL